MPRKQTGHLAAEAEQDSLRDAMRGFEPKGSCGFIRYLEHGVPSPLVRWHYHEEYELHLILETHGKVFVGDYIGQFRPGHLVLTGPGLPHNWVSADLPAQGVALRDMVIQFSHQPMEALRHAVPELACIFPLLKRAVHGIEFLGMQDSAQQRFMRIRDSGGLQRFMEFLALLDELAQCSDYRLLSTTQRQMTVDDAALAGVNSAIDFIVENYSNQFTMGELSREIGISESAFSRFFRAATGNTFAEFVNRLRVNKACQLLMETDRYITNVCYEVGYNNVANFNRRFLELKGMTPKEFRNQAQGRFGG